MPHWAAIRQGFFADYGLDVGITLIPGTAANVEALLDGSIQFANIPAPAVVDANACIPGSDLVFVASGRVTVAQQYMAVPEIRQVQDLRGRRIAVRVRPTDRIGELDTALWRFVLRDFGLDPHADVEFVPAHSHADLVDALSDGRAEAMTVVPPFSFDALKRGFSVIFDGRTAKNPWQLGGVVSRRSYVDQNPDVTKALVRAYAEGLSFVMTNIGAAEDLMMEYSFIQDPWVIERSVDFYIGAYTWPPRPTVVGLQHVIDELAHQRPEALGLRAEECVHTRALDELTAEGVIDALQPPPYIAQFD